MRTLINLEYNDLNDEKFVDFYQRLGKDAISKNDNLTILYNPFKDVKNENIKKILNQNLFSDLESLKISLIKEIKELLKSKLQEKNIKFSDIIITDDKNIIDICERNLIDFYVSKPQSENIIPSKERLKSIVIYQRTSKENRTTEGLYQVLTCNYIPQITPKLLKDSICRGKFEKYQPKEGERIHLGNFSKAEVERYKRLEQLTGMSLLDVIKYKNQDYIDEVAMEWQGVKYTYQDIFQNVDKIANFLDQEGIEENEIVGISSANTPTAIFAILACHKLGAIPSLYHPYSSKEQFKSFLDLEKPRVMIMLEVEKTWNNIKDLIEDSSINSVITIPASLGGPLKLKVGAALLQSKAFSIYSSLKDLKNSKLSKKDRIANVKSRIIKPSFKTEIKRHKSVNRWQDIYNDNVITTKKKYNETAVIVHTTGSQGTPKSVVLTHDQLNLNQAGIEAFMTDFKRGDVLLGVPQIFHILGLNACVLLALRLGFKLTLASSYKADKFHLYFNKEKVSFLLIVPTIAKDMKAHQNLYDEDAFSELTYMYMGGESINPNEYEDISDFIHEKSAGNRHLTVGSALGATETGCLVSATAVGESDYKTVGKCIINNDVKVVDPETGNILGTNQTGELYISSPSLMTKYYKNEELTSKAIKFDGEVKWLTLGDLGFIDENGNINLVGRKDNAFKIDGVKVSEEKIKDILYQIPAIEEVVLFKATNQECKNSVGAIVVLREEYQSQEENIRHLIYKMCEQLDSKQRVRYIEFVKELNQNIGMKTDIKDIKKTYETKILTFTK